MAGRPRSDPSHPCRIPAQAPLLAEAEAELRAQPGAIALPRRSSWSSRLASAFTISTRRFASRACTGTRSCRRTSSRWSLPSPPIARRRFRSSRSSRRSTRCMRTELFSSRVSPTPRSGASRSTRRDLQPTGAMAGAAPSGTDSADVDDGPRRGGDGDRRGHEVTTMKIPSRSALPWALVVVLAAALVVVATRRPEAPGYGGSTGLRQHGPRRSPRRDPLPASVAFSTGSIRWCPATSRTSPASPRSWTWISCRCTTTARVPGGRSSSVGGYASISISPDRQQAIGIQLGKAEVRELTQTIRAVGRVTLDETLLFQIRPKFEGYVEDLFVDYTGKPVRKGQPLLSIYSPELLATQQEYLLAVRARQRLGGSSNPDVARGAAALYESARQRLLLWDIRPADIERLETIWPTAEGPDALLARRRVRADEERGARRPRDALRHAVRDRRPLPCLGPRRHLRVGGAPRAHGRSGPDDACRLCPGASGRARSPSSLR